VTTTTTFAAWLRETRNRCGLSQGELAQRATAHDKRARVHQARVSEWERGVRLPSLRQFAALCVALGLDAAAHRQGEDCWKASALEDGDTLDQETSEDSEPDTLADEPAPAARAGAV
jgi:transcriptional regulator with XRE-family HTH domain